MELKYYTVTALDAGTESIQEKLWRLRGKVFSVEILEKYSGIIFTDLYSDEKTRADIPLERIVFNPMEGQADIYFDGLWLSIRDILALCPTSTFPVYQSSPHYDIPCRVTLRRTETQLILIVQWKKTHSSDQFKKFIEEKVLSFKTCEIFPMDGIGDSSTEWGAITSLS